MGTEVTRVLLLLLLLPLPLAGRGEVLDRIVAVVEREVITASELEGQLLLYQTQLGLAPSEREEVEELRREILKTMIENRILLAEAERETLEVAREEIESALEDALRGIRERFPSEKEFQAQLEAENTSVQGLKERYREEMKRSLLVQKLIQKKLKPRVSVTHLDVERYYQQNPDSIPEEPATVRISHILVPITPSEEMEEEAQGTIQEILSALEAGVSFSHLARKYSGDPGSKEKGGDLGYFGKGEMVPEFEEAAFSLEIGRITVIRSRFGFHVIRCEDRREGEVRARHILVKVGPSKRDSVRARETADKVREMALSRDFASLASEYSEDEATKERGGELGVFRVEELPSPFRQAIKDLEAGEVTGVVQSESGYHVVKVLERKEARTPTFDEIKDRLKAYLTQRRMEEEYERWLEKLKEGVYIENRLN